MLRKFIASFCICQSVCLCQEKETEQRKTSSCTVLHKSGYLSCFLQRHAAPFQNENYFQNRRAPASMARFHFGIPFFQSGSYLPMPLPGYYKPAPAGNACQYYIPAVLQFIALPLVYFWQPSFAKPAKYIFLLWIKQSFIKIIFILKQLYEQKKHRLFPGIDNC
jgi:hypothetical protein